MRRMASSSAAVAAVFAAVMAGVAASGSPAADASAPATANAAAAGAPALSWVAGVNYVPSTSHNDMATLLDYNETLVEQELAWAGNGTSGAGFNAVRLFLHWLPWQHDPQRFFAVLDHFIATSAANGMAVLLVTLDSCFGDVNADASWISSGKYKNYSWIPNPGPAIVGNSSAWGPIDAYITALVTRYASDPRLLGWDVHNEPDFSNPGILDFLAHYTALVQQLDTNPAHVVTVGIASSGQQGLVQGMVRTLSFHDYDGGGHPLPGLNLASTIAQQQALAASLGKAVLLTESMSRPNDLLTSVLPAVKGCFAPSATSAAAVPTSTTAAANVASTPTAAPSPYGPIGFFVWELMLGVDQFNADWDYPYQGLVYPSWDTQGRGGTWWNESERALLWNYTRYWNSSDPSAVCPPVPQRNYTDVPDTDPSIAYAPPAAWTAWQGSGPRDGTLHYCNTSGCVLAVSLINGTHYSVVHKTGPDCGIMDVYWDGALVSSVDTYTADVNWGAELAVPGSGLDPSTRHDLVITVTGKANPASSNAYVQIVGFNEYWV